MFNQEFAEKGQHEIKLDDPEGLELDPTEFKELMDMIYPLQMPITGNFFYS